MSSFRRALPMVQVTTKLLFQPRFAWIYIFLPALIYFMSTRLYSVGLFRSSTYGDVMEYQLSIVKGDCAAIWKQHSRSFLYVTKDCQSLKYPIYKVLEDTTESIVATAWKEDPELGRGYLLLSSQANKGRIYQWETGGGPIAIGRTLHLQDSGCRSNIYKNCTKLQSNLQLGSGGIAVDTTTNNVESSSSQPLLLVAEYGEGRITRLEDNGARTPLVIQVAASSNTDNDGDTQRRRRRLCEPFRLLVTPYKDLMVLERTTLCHHPNNNNNNNNNEIENDHPYVLWRLHKVNEVPALSSLAISRQAHGWTAVNSTKQQQQQQPKRFFYSSAMGGMAMDSSGHQLLVTTIDTQTNQALVISLPLSTNDDDDDDDNTTTSSSSSSSINMPQSQLVLNYSDHAKQPGAIATDSNGNMYLATDTGILVVSKSKEFVIKLEIPHVIQKGPVTDLTVGSDKFLYITTEHTLLRMSIPGSVLVLDKDTLRKNLNTAIL
ncbi:hypothetical protein IV203_027146 [Nitzschia inconspicua]|uniref:Uncharacterized protein n=1 Tax=Nitzschia inconspicua TaxID=303405 RepID=A0A9K3LJY1_9STRA|nr:hypothetical protein IV203_027146 [Nitzschia inconspicua]